MPHSSRARCSQSESVDALIFNLGDSRLVAMDCFHAREVVARPKVSPSAERGGPKITLRDQEMRALDVASLCGVASSASPRGVAAVVRYNGQDVALIMAGFSRAERLDRAAISSALGRGQEALSDKVALLADGSLAAWLDPCQLLSAIQPISEGRELGPLLAADPSSPWAYVVDGSAVGRKILAESCSGAGLNVMTSCEPDQAWRDMERWGRRLVDERAGLSSELSIVFLDADLPAGSCYDMCAKMRQDPVFKNVAAVIHSSSTSRVNAPMAEAVGAWASLQSFSPDGIRGVIERITKERAHGR